MTVQELLRELQKYNPDAIVLLDCDDIGQVEADDVQEVESKRYVVITI